MISPRRRVLCMRYVNQSDRKREQWRIAPRTIHRRDKLLEDMTIISPLKLKLALDDRLRERSWSFLHRKVWYVEHGDMYVGRDVLEVRDGQRGFATVCSFREFVSECFCNAEGNRVRPCVQTWRRLRQSLLVQSEYRRCSKAIGSDVPCHGWESGATGYWEASGIDSLVADRHETDCVPLSPIRHPSLPVHVPHIVHVAHDLELVFVIPPGPRVFQRIMPEREAARVVISIIHNDDIAGLGRPVPAMVVAAAGTGRWRPQTHSY